MYLIAIALILCTLPIVSTQLAAAAGSTQKNPTNADLYSMSETIRSQINHQINKELHASLAYMAMGAHFGRDSVNRHGLKKFFMKNAHEEYDHAMQLVNYLISRNGHLDKINVTMPDKHSWKDANSALLEAFNLEKKVSNKLSALHDHAINEKDLHLADMLESVFFHEQVESMRKLQGYMTTLSTTSKDMYLAEYLLDQQLIKDD
jgi:ferritin heavy chain